MKKNIFTVFIGFALLFGACKSNTNKGEKISTTDANGLLEKRFENLLDYQVDALSFPRSMSLNPEEIHKVPSKDWTSGFFPGNLWQIYALTGKKEFKDKAMEWTALMEDQQWNDKTHDMGFKIFCSFGEGLKYHENQYYKDVIVQSAKTLCTRYNSNVKLLRSWDFNADIWEFPVIIDNMMNLELLFEATKISGDSTFHKIAEQHAKTTLNNHFRPDNSTYHVVVYDTINGTVKQKVTHQGIHDESSWARGQGWAIYGFTMAYRYTKNKEFLEQAEATATYYMSHKNLPEDGIPYWDFDLPSGPDTPRDASAAALVSSGLFELYSYTKKQSYSTFATRVLNNLNSKNYLLEESINGPFILKHSTGNGPKNDEIDEPIVYADYYFLEALLRQKKYSVEK